MLALVLGQCVAALGFPLAVRAGEAIRACGCPVNGPSAACCCDAAACCVTPPPPPEPACPNCRTQATAKPAAEPEPPVRVAWVKPGGCRGEGPLGALAEVPSVPPPRPNPALTAPARTGVVAPADRFPTSVRHLPADPPPRHV
ncbi:MAG: hypothetical protein C0501_17425 [Isosphaera sp.]|nr:hypothetical protein [Isosphaera sp.]